MSETTRYNIDTTNGPRVGTVDSLTGQLLDSVAEYVDGAECECDEGHTCHRCLLDGDWQALTAARKRALPARTLGGPQNANGAS